MCSKLYHDDFLNCGCGRYWTRGRVGPKVRSKQLTNIHTRAYAPNQELHMQPYLPIIYHNNNLVYCILLF